MSGDKFMLRWNEFEASAPSCLRSMWEYRNFTDVTLATSDNQQITAHKIILSSSSSFFKNVLQSNAHPNPLLYLKGIRHSELESILKFIYSGQVEVAHEDLETFLATGQELGINGLLQVADGQVDADMPVNAENAEKVIEESRVGSKHDTDHEVEPDSNAVILETPMEEGQASKTSRSKYKYEKLQEQYEIQLSQDIQFQSNINPNFPTKRSKNNKPRPNPDFNFDIRKPQKKQSQHQPAPFKPNKQIQIVRKGPPIVLPCDICGTQFLAEATLEQHKLKSHTVQFFSCDLCNFRALEVNTFKQHKLKQHCIST